MNLLWSSGQQIYSMLECCLFLSWTKKILDQELIDTLVTDLMIHDFDQRNHLTDWLLANQLMKSKKTVLLLESWEHSPFSMLRRLFWYHQARLRRTGQTPPDNTLNLLESLEKNMKSEEPEVQWAMNFTAGQIGIHDPKFRDRCIKLGETLELYKDEVVPKNCTPNYLPEFIRIKVNKRQR